MFERVTAAAVLALAVSAPLGAQQFDGVNVNWGVHVAYPEYLSGSIGVNVSAASGREERRGYFIRFEPGYYGGRLNFGRYTGIENGMYSTHVGVMQTWNGGPGMGPSTTYLGAEQRVTIAGIEAGIGYYFRTSGTTNALLSGSNNSAPFGVLTFILGANFFR